MKKLLAIIATVILVLLIAAPAMANGSGGGGGGDISTTVTVGGGGTNAQWMVALFMTPDMQDGAANGTNILPEPPTPPFVTSSTPSLTDGWKKVLFYVMVSDNADPLLSSINTVDVAVSYPNTSPYSGQLKFNLTASLVGTSWIASDNYGVAESYPDGTAATVPTWAVRPLVCAPPSGNDIVNTNANDVVSIADGDSRLYTGTPATSFLNSWGTRVVYGQDDNGPDPGAVPYTADSAGAAFNAGKVLCLELTGWIWFHQDPIVYTVDASCGTEHLTNHFQFVPTTSLYMDFNPAGISYGTVPANSTFTKTIQGDNDLSTAKPTVWDNGNVNAQLSVSATALIRLDNGNQTRDPALAVPGGANYNYPKIITDFDAFLDYKLDDGTVAQSGKVTFNSALYDDLDPQTGTPTLITVTGSTTEPVLLRACHPAQFDPSIEALAGKVAGQYKGTMTLYIDQYAGTVYPKFFSNLPGVTIPVNFVLPPPTLN